MRLLVATGNAGKLREMRELLGGLDVEVVSPAELGLDVEAEETGETFHDNARIKAINACGLSGLPSVGEDSGLCVDALGGAPGVYSARFGGGITDAEKCALLLEKLKNSEQRSAKFVSTIVCRFPNGDELTAFGECSGEITRWPCGDGGFGYDPVFFITELRRTMAELTAEEKNAVSHRGAAMRKFASALEAYIKEKAC